MTPGLANASSRAAMSAASPPSSIFFSSRRVIRRFRVRRSLLAAMVTGADCFWARRRAFFHSVDSVPALALAGAGAGLFVASSRALSLFRFWLHLREGCCDALGWRQGRESAWRVKLARG